MVEGLVPVTEEAQHTLFCPLFLLFLHPLVFILTVGQFRNLVACTTEIFEDKINLYTC